MGATIGRPRTCECGECRKCHARDYMRKWWAGLTPERRAEIVAKRSGEGQRAVDKKRAGTERRKASLRASSARQRRRHAVAKAAQDKVAKALMAGSLTRQPCVVCRDPKAEAHHDDYSRPLDVRWLCRPHHKAHHGHLRADYPMPEVA